MDMIILFLDNLLKELSTFKENGYYECRELRKLLQKKII